MGIYKYLQQNWKKPSKESEQAYRQQVIEWRNGAATTRLDHPTRLDRARSLGFKAKQGFLIVRQRVTRGGKMRPKPAGGRSSKKYSRQKVVHLSYQSIAEQRAYKKFENCEVLNSYWVAKDGDHYYYEVILVDTGHPAIQADPSINWICDQKRRVLRGKTSASRKTRGLRRKGTGAEKVRPSLRANEGLLH